ncbi:hypothetical protein [Kribbella sp. CA-293567]|uniref:hypothetical protein n=1 Tax=Kribbella sp. CA-293567 TaxID=3002436 RepID=UPI0022DD732A|nr:hypothetical protein [Kribbella sp. CA-293567]WBQ07811.1 hypothetical protein OX958_13665 [Kribbella sp. CA-293567]
MTLKVTSAGLMTRMGLTATRTSGTINRDVRISNGGRLATVWLRKAMYQPGKGSWYNAQLALDRFARLLTVYDNPPFDGLCEPQLLIEDQDLYPREPAALPIWHPCLPGGPTVALWTDDDYR